MGERLQKILSQWGIASRRQAEQMIIAGRVKVNDQVVQLGARAIPNLDKIEVDGLSVKPEDRPEHIYLLLNKPIGVISTCAEPSKRSKVLDILSIELRNGKGIHPVGRLDADSTGALLLTNDGRVTYALTHPKHCLPKTYQVLVEGHPQESVLELWRQGIILSGKKTLPAQVKVLKEYNGTQTFLEVIISEGRNRQIRRIAERLGYPVLKLHRTAIGQIKLQLPGESVLPTGHYRPLQHFEVDFLNAQIIKSQFC
ncbi:pseudouridine synthase [Okeania sp.]|uniref:pseudouridine synthase n=1 Tax=Okeania sp. TaxID=3100323 RepID=UPI002B4AE10A|nr:pseudouridine synthase [Okeania sp.]MEB3339247.1 pseudouridine synthase [Okeania sp.]